MKNENGSQVCNSPKESPAYGLDGASCGTSCILRSSFLPPGTAWANLKKRGGFVVRPVPKCYNLTNPKPGFASTAAFHAFSYCDSGVWKMLGLNLGTRACTFAVVSAATLA